METLAVDSTLEERLIQLHRKQLTRVVHYLGGSKSPRIVLHANGSWTVETAEGVFTHTGFTATPEGPCPSCGRSR